MVLPVAVPPRAGAAPRAPAGASGARTVGARISGAQISGARIPGARRAGGHFLRARGGATAVEFGLLGLPFLALACASVEAGIVYWEQEILQQAVVEAGRSIYTGQFQTANAAVRDSATLIANFKRKVCTLPSGATRLTIFDCSRVRVSVTQAATLAGAAPVAPVATGSNGVSDWNAGFQGYTCAGASAIMVVQAAVDVPVYFPLLNSTAASVPGKRRVLQAATVFKVEPYTTASVCS